MANTKDVYMEVWVPFDWTSNLTAMDEPVWPSQGAGSGEAPGD